ncbi:MAG: HAMP domain-containing histidine kinase [Candidatus Riflebacteria bacterium]|nr:HAMP domain-containing histidine kinase [Candidatus Riflebacteria bacterium]
MRHPASAGRVSRQGGGSAAGATWMTELERLAKNGSSEMKAELQRLLEKVKRSQDAEDLARRRLLDGYSDLAALGQAAIGTQATIDPLISAASGQCEELRSLLNGSGTREIRDSIDTMQELLRVASRRLSMLALMETGISRRRRNIDVPEELERVRDVLTPILESAGVEMLLDVRAHGVLRVEMRPETFARLLHILAMNSIEWLKGMPERWIRVKAGAEAESCNLLFCDSGPGISRDLAERVFEPTFSTKENGRGMGLTIARHIVMMHGGTIEVDTDQRRRGANIRIVLPRKKSRATISG